MRMDFDSSPQLDEHKHPDELSMSLSRGSESITKDLSGARRITSSRLEGHMVASEFEYRHRFLDDCARLCSSLFVL
jgi:hypothetical protein